MKNEKLNGIIRHTLTFIGGILVMKGIADAGHVEEIIGALVTLGGMIWSIFSKDTNDNPKIEE